MMRYWRRGAIGVPTVAALSPPGLGDDPEVGHPEQAKADFFRV